MKKQYRQWDSVWSAAARRGVAIVLTAVLAATGIAGCGSSKGTDTQSSTQKESSTEQTQNPASEAVQDTEQSHGKVASREDMTTVEDVVEEGMVPIGADKLNEGVYTVAVDSSSSMFSITSAELTVKDGAMRAVMSMKGTGYLYVYMGSAQEAAEASEEAYISYEEVDGVHTFTVPVQALDQGIACAAFSKRKEMWYDRTLVFRSDSLAAADGSETEAFKEGAFATAESLGLSDGEYTAEVALSGGSGKAGVESPARLHVKDKKVTAVITWSSSHYDYMLLDGQKYEPVNTEGNSTFEIPVAYFDRAIAIVADTTAMSTPHEIAYTLKFDSSTIKEAQEN